MVAGHYSKRGKGSWELIRSLNMRNLGLIWLLEFQEKMWKESGVIRPYWVVLNKEKTLKTHAICGNTIYISFEPFNSPQTLTLFVILSAMQT